MEEAEGGYQMLMSKIIQRERTKGNYQGLI